MFNLLESNPHNRGAIEYLTADYLIEGKLKEAIGNIGRFRDIGCAQLPRHLQEAVLLYEQVYREKPDTKGYDINPEVRRRFNKFKQFSRGRDKTTAKPKLLPIFGDTYYFYYIFPKQRKK